LGDDGAVLRGARRAKVRRLDLRAQTMETFMLMAFDINVFLFDISRLIMFPAP